MKFADRVVVAVNINENVAQILNPLRELEFLNHSEIHLGARERRGIFESSFSHYVNKHTACNLIILKHKI